jgi:tetratricopeptide (TPR) repeat protein
MSALAIDLTPPLTHPAVTPALRLVSAAEEGLVADAEAAIERHEYSQAVAALATARPSATTQPELAFRSLLAESWGRMELGQVEQAVTLLEQARALAERPAFGDAERADVLFRLGCCRLKLSAVANAVSLLTLALELCDNRLRVRVLERRARCYVRQRDWDAARADVELALELAAGLGDTSIEAQVQLQASIVAERQGNCLLARCYAEQALALCEADGDRLSTHKVLNNLGGLNFLLGSLERGISCLQDSFRIALDLGDDVGAAYAMSSLAQIQLRSGDPHAAEPNARRAIELLAGREDHVVELGNAQLVLGRTLLEQERREESSAMFRSADDSFERSGSVSQRAAVWVAQGDLAASRGDANDAAREYRRAAEALQDFRF